MRKQPGCKSGIASFLSVIPILAGGCGGIEDPPNALGQGPEVPQISQSATEEMLAEMGYPAVGEGRLANSYCSGTLIQRSYSSSPAVPLLEWPEDVNGDFTMADVDGDGKSDLVYIKRRGTDTLSIEVHVLSAVSSYQRFIQQTGTALSVLEDANGDFTMADVDGDGKPDLVYIKRRSTDSGNIEVSVLSAASGYQQFIQQTETPLSMLEDANGDFTMADVDGDGKPDLVYIKRRSTDSGNIEVSVLSAASGYQQLIQQRVAALSALEDANGDFSMTDVDGDGKPDLVYIKRRSTGTGNIEVSVLSATSGYRRLIRQRATALSTLEDAYGDFTLTDVDGDGHPDFVYIKRRETGTEKIEVSVLSAVSGYQRLIQRQTGTPLFASEDTNGYFTMIDADGDGQPDLVYVKSRNTETQRIEIHIVAAEWGYQHFAQQSMTALSALEDAYGDFVVADVDGDWWQLDLFYIKRRSTDSGTIEVSILSARTGYQEVVLEGQQTALSALEDANGDFTMADVDVDGRPDLVYIKRRNTATGRIEVYVLSGVSRYQEFLLVARTPLSALEDANGDFIMADVDRDGQPDLVYIKRRNTATGRIDISVLSAASGYRRFIQQRATALSTLEDAQGDFAMADVDGDGRLDLVYIKDRNTDTGRVEMYVLSAASGYQRFLLQQTGTAVNCIPKTGGG